MTDDDVLRHCRPAWWVPPRSTAAYTSVPMAKPREWPPRLRHEGFRPGMVRDYAWGNGNRDECARLLGEPMAAAIYDGPEPEVERYTVRCTSVRFPGDDDDRA